MSEPSTETPREEQRTGQRRSVLEIFRYSRPDTSPEDFQRMFLRRLASSLSGEAAAVWFYDGDGTFHLKYQWKADTQELRRTDDGWMRHGRLLFGVASREQPVRVGPGWGAGDGSVGAPGNPTDRELLLVPLSIGGKRKAVIEVFRAPGERAGDAEDDLRRLEQFGEFAADYFRSEELRRIAGQQHAWEELDEFARRVHASLDPREIAFFVANDGRKVIGCDRLSVAFRRGRRMSLEAVSGQESVNSRSNLVRALTALARIAAEYEEALHYTPGRKEVPPHFAAAIEQYRVEHDPRTLIVLPFRTPAGNGKTDGALVIERFESESLPADLTERAQFLGAHCAAALGNALRHERIFLLPLWVWLGGWRQRFRSQTLFRLAAVLALLAAVVLTLSFVPAELKLAGNGVLRAEQRRGIFAAEEGTVRQVLVSHGERVSAGQPVLRLENVELSIRLREAEAKLLQAQGQLQAKEAERGDRRLTGLEQIRLNGEILQLEETISHLGREIELVRQRVEQLTVRASMDGMITSWLPQQELIHRPVGRGHLLLYEVDESGPWNLEIDLPEDRAGYVLRAFRGLPEGERLPVEYILATRPERRYRGWVQEIAPRTESRLDAHVVRARVALDPDDLPELREGAEVSARFLCGERPLGFVWFRELVEFAYTRVLF